VRSLLFVALAACDMGPPPVAVVAMPLDALDGCVVEVARISDVGRVGQLAVRLADGTWRGIDAHGLVPMPTPESSLSIAPRRGSVDATLAGRDTNVRLYDDRARPLASYRFASPACAHAIERVRWWDVHAALVVAIEYDCEPATCRVATVPIPKDLPVE
jgi:hypothetical protein